MRKRIFHRLEMRQTLADSAALEADDDFPLANMIRELIYNPRTTRDTTPDAAKKPVSDELPPSPLR